MILDTDWDNLEDETPSFCFTVPAAQKGRDRGLKFFHGSSSRDHYWCHPREFPISTTEPRYKGLRVPTLGVKVVNCSAQRWKLEIRLDDTSSGPLMNFVWAAGAVKQNRGGLIF